jgi:twitching motility protein PilU
MVTLDELLKEAAQNQASDLYLAAGAVPCMCCDGIYRPVTAAKNQRASAEDMERFARSACTEKQWREFENSLEMNLAYMTPETGRFRVNIFWQRGSIAMVCRRVIMNIPTMRSLALPLVLRKVAIADRGIVLVTGSTGSGKSTTLASMIDYRNHLLPGHIVTIEDPVEFVYRHRRSIVTQREVGIDTHSFHEALKNTLRQAPKVICIGEMRDAETVQFAMHASETGHLVFATLHSTNSVLALERILHFYPGEMKEQVQQQLALNLNSIICQRLVQRIGGGRCAAHEILLNTPRIMDLIGKGDMGAIKLALAQENQDGIVNFERSLYKLAMRGLITKEEALTAAESANDLQIKFRGIGVLPSWNDLSDPWENIPGDYEMPEDHPLYQKIRDGAGTGLLAYNNEVARELPTSMPLSPAVGGQQPPPPQRGPLPTGAPPRPQQPPPPMGQPQQAPPPQGPPRVPSIPLPGSNPGTGGQPNTNPTTNVRFRQVAGGVPPGATPMPPPPNRPPALPQRPQAPQQQPGVPFMTPPPSDVSDELD